MPEKQSTRQLTLRIQQLEKELEEYRLLVENQTDLVVKTDLKGRFIFVSPSFCRMFGRSESGFLNSRFLQLVHPDEKEKTAAIYSRLVPAPHTTYVEHRAKAPDGWRWLGWACTGVLDSADRLTAIVGVGRDITELKSMQDELRQAHKMESVGILAGGVAHDFNNILSIILGNAELAQDETDPAVSRDCIREIKTASLRARDIVKQLLSFSRKTEKEKLPVDIIPIVKESLKLIRSFIPSGIRIRSRMPARRRIICADATQIHQIIINLCSNAADAMRPDSGLLEVLADECYVDTLPGETPAQAGPGPYLKIRVRDNGTGIDPEIREKIFDPYFTTKAVGKGTGMGLSVVHGIVENHGGHIRVASEPGAGTTFSIFLPIIDLPADKGPALSDPASVAGGGEHILFLDDESAIVESTSKMLGKLGYTVYPETDPLNALDTVLSTPDRFDLLITDMTMPGMGGPSLARKIRDAGIDLPVILCTGYNEGVDEINAEEAGVSACAMKPVSISEIGGIIRRVLDSDL